MAFISSAYLAFQFIFIRFRSHTFIIASWLRDSDIAHASDSLAVLASNSYEDDIIAEVWERQLLVQGHQRAPHRMKLGTGGIALLGDSFKNVFD